MNKGQFVISVGIVVALSSGVVGGVVGFFTSKAQVSRDISTVREAFAVEQVTNRTDHERLEGKLDALLANFKIEYVPKETQTANISSLVK